MKKFRDRLFLLLFYAFLYAPILVLIVFSFNEGKTRGRWDAFSLTWYLQLFQDEEILSSLRNTLSIAALATLFSTLIGTFGAIGLFSFRTRLRRVILAFNRIPVINPDIVMAVGLMVLYRSLHLDFGYLSLLLSHIAFTVPYVVLSVLPKLRQMPRALPEAAMDLGATPFQTLWRVVLPYCKGGIFSGALIAFTLSIDDFVISFFTTGNGIETVSTTVYSMARRGINPKINALSSLLFLTTIVLLVLMNLRRSPQKEVLQ
uniref:ABC transporter permease n=1 Tax=Ndongobacter massiliensis TaxID=1871025 RepID=UPI0009303732|nr:ABC transporter permease [Ndongobacter massiliensis]